MARHFPADYDGLCHFTIRLLVVMYCTLVIVIMFVLMLVFPHTHIHACAGKFYCLIITHFCIIYYNNVIDV